MKSSPWAFCYNTTVNSKDKEMMMKLASALAVACIALNACADEYDEPVRPVGVNGQVVSALALEDLATFDKGR